jgi:GT2 family glycosyltransferase/SAM-dependent methyltransferase
MATVSILIPARKAQFLARAIGSAQRQSFEDIEIIVGDDTADAALAPIVRSIADPRVRYVHHGFRDMRRNSEALFELANGRYVKWLADDDLLLPNSVALLVDALKRHPDSALAFHGRTFIDENDALVHQPPLLVNPGERALIGRDMLVADMVGQMHNFVGEPSNVMIDRLRASKGALGSYRSLALDYLLDVAMYLNLAEQAPIVVVGGYLSMLRRHPGVTTPATRPNYSAGLYEWEVLVRGEAAAGRLSGEALERAATRLRQAYAGYALELPEIGRFLANLDELTTAPANTLFDSPRFQSDLAHARAAVAARVGQSAATPATSAGEHAAASAPVKRAAMICAICEQQVQAWRSPGEPQEHALLDAIEPVGSARGQQLCPSCGSSERERHLWLSIALSRLLERASEMRILHLAPEPLIESRIRRLAPLEYVTVAMGQALDLPADHFDLIICNDVLQRVDSASAVLTELRRCLKRGGHLIAQTQYAPALRHTFEVTKMHSADFAKRYFGNAEQRRCFGADVVDHFEAAGFAGALRGYSELLAEVDPRAWGIDPQQPFFLFERAEPAQTIEAVGSATLGQVIAAAESTITAHAERAARNIPANVQPARAAELADRPIRIVCASRSAQSDFLQSTALGRSLCIHRHARPPELLLFDNNTTGLSTLYNAAIEQAASNPAILVFVHDDVSIVDHFWMARIREALLQFDIVGLAGNKRRSPMQPGWAFATRDFKWDSPEFLSGSVGHGKGFPCDEVSHFGPSGVECKLLDGLMLVADSARLMEAGVRFDEQFDFHFYDMDLCRQAELKGLRMGTWPISVVHESAGAFNTPPWRAGYERYLRKYGE